MWARVVDRRETPAPQSGSGGQGAQGPAGPQGPKGDTGATGPQGPQGEVGPQGSAGADGTGGGTTGLSWHTGPLGFDGPSPDVGSTGDMFYNTAPTDATGNQSRAVVEVYGPKASLDDAGGDPNAMWGAPAHVNGLNPHAFVSIDGGWVFNAAYPGAAPLTLGTSDPATGDNLAPETAGLWFDGSALHVASLDAGGISRDTTLGGHILTSPNGTAYRLTVADDGALSTEAV